MKKLLTTAIGMLSLTLSASDDIQVESKLIFNTICAKCHEGECSGRLSFHLKGNAADQHILRHGGELSPASIRELSELLRYMKEKCSFYPMSIDITQEGILDKKMLERLKSPTGMAYFIPLGSVKPGNYIINLEGIGAGSSSCMEIIDSGFEFVEKRVVSDASGKIAVKFHIGKQADIYLRMTSQRPFSLNRLEMIRE